MIVCSCKGVRDSQLRALRETCGERDVVRLGDAVRALGIGTGCGRCLRHARRLMDESSAGSEAGVVQMVAWHPREMPENCQPA